MPASVTWKEVEADFASLEKTGVYPPLDGAIEPIQRLIGSRQYSPGTVKRLIEMVSGMSAEFGNMVRQEGATGKNRALRQVMHHAEARFHQEKFNVEYMNQAQTQTILQFILGEVKKEVEEPKPSISIPVVLLVMNQQEAKELNGGKITVEMPKNYLDEFKKLTDLLNPDWLKRYGKTPEDWKPFDVPGDTIEDLMTKTFEEVRQDSGPQKLIVPDFVDVRTLSADREKLKTLRRNGCFVINDVISLWHPVIQLGYRASLLEAFPSTIVYRIAPIVQALKVSQPLIAYVEKYEDLEFFQRIKDKDLNCRMFFESGDFSTFVVNYALRLIPAEDKETSLVTKNIVGRNAG